MNKEKTVLFITTRLPFPTTSGRKTSLYYYCKILSEKLGYRLIVASFEEEDIKSNIKKPDFIDKLIILPNPKVKTKLANVIKYSFILKKFPMQVSLYWDKKIDNIIKKIVCDEKPFIVIGDMIRTTEYIRKLKCYRIADLDDRISLRYKRQLKYSIDDINPYGTYLKRFPTILQKILLWKPFKMLITKNEIKLLENYELEIGRVCDKVIFVAESEAIKFNEEINEKKAVAVPIGVDINYFKYQKEKIDDDLNIGFLGALSVTHNESAVKYFIERIFPIINKNNPNIKFMIIGGGANKELLKYKCENIIFTGKVDDIREYLRKCKVFVCPLTFGSGIKTKNLEAMAIGLPVVTTSIGAENINAENLKDWIVTDDEENFANSVLKLMEDKNMRELMGYNACKYVNNNFTWNIAENRLKEIIEKV